MPMQAIRKYSSSEPRREAPAPSRVRARVKLRLRPSVVDSTTTHTNGASRLNCEAQLTLPLNQAASGAPMACDRPTPPKATATISIRSVRLGMRSCSAWKRAMRSFSSSIAEVSAPLRASIFAARPARKISAAIHT